MLHITDNCTARQWLFAYCYGQLPGTSALVCTWIGVRSSMSISVDSSSNRRGTLALLLRRLYEFPFGINIVQFSICAPFFQMIAETLSQCTNDPSYCSNVCLFQNCIITDFSQGNESPGWWSVFLGKPYTVSIYRIAELRLRQVYNRSPQQIAGRIIDIL